MKIASGKDKLTAKKTATPGAMIRKGVSLEMN